MKIKPSNCFCRKKGACFRCLSSICLVCRHSCCAKLETLLTIVVGVLKGVLCQAQSEHGMLCVIARRALDGFNGICRRAS